MEFTSYPISIVCLCCKHGGSVTSWGRTVEHNKAVGGVPDSYHLLWLGFDVVLNENKQNPEFESDAKLFGLFALWEKDHYHLQPVKS